MVFPPSREMFLVEVRERKGREEEGKREEGPREREQEGHKGQEKVGGSGVSGVMEGCKGGCNIQESQIRSGEGREEGR